MRYLVKHGDGDYRVHNEDGSETGTAFSWKDDWLTERTDQMVRDTSDIETPWNYRDLTIESESVPW